jgi:CheY-like chemotaxis protein
MMMKCEVRISNFALIYCLRHSFLYYYQKAQMSPTKHTILYAEDDPDDLYIVKQAFEALDEGIEVIHAENGLKVLEYINLLDPNGSLPCLIILDMNMPGMDGRETLIRIKQIPHFKKVPVVLFTTSSSRVDQDFAKRWGVDFITKPVKYSELEELAKLFVSRCDFEMSKRA